MELVYVAGPYRGKSKNKIINKLQVIRNVIRARAVAKQLWEMGYAVICPHSNSALFSGVAPDKAFLEGSIAMLKQCGSIVMLPGWRDSEGSKAELRAALQYRKKIFVWGPDSEGDLDPRDVELIKKMDGGGAGNDSCGDRIVKIKIGYELPPERWLAAKENLEKVFPTIAQRLLLINNDGRGQEDMDDFMADAELALTAMQYVAEFAYDKCRFIPIPEKKK